MDEEKKYRKTVYWIFRHEQEEAEHGGGAGVWWLQGAPGLHVLIPRWPQRQQLCTCPW